MILSRRSSRAASATAIFYSVRWPSSDSNASARRRTPSHLEGGYNHQCYDFDDTLDTYIVPSQLGTRTTDTSTSALVDHQDVGVATTFDQKQNPAPPHDSIYPPSPLPPSSVPPSPHRCSMLLSTMENPFLKAVCATWAAPPAASTEPDAAHSGDPDHLEGAGHHQQPSASPASFICEGHHQ
jgi:hypothetical protein